MACRAGEDMLETFDTDDEVSLLDASNAGSTEEQTVQGLVQSPRYHDGTIDLEKSPPAPSPDLGINIATSLEQPPQKIDGDLSRVLLSSGHACEAFLHICTAKIARTGQPGCLPKKGSTLIGIVRASW